MKNDRIRSARSSNGIGNATDVIKCWSIISKKLGRCTRTDNVEHDCFNPCRETQWLGYWRSRKALNFFAFSFLCSNCPIPRSYIAFGRGWVALFGEFKCFLRILWMVGIDSTLRGSVDCSAKENKEWTNLNPLLSVQNPPKWTTSSSFRSESATLPWPVNPAGPVAQNGRKTKCRPFSTRGRQQKKLRENVRD